MESDFPVILSDAAWAWEGLRRNPGYIQAWERHRDSLPDLCDRRGSVRYLALNKPYLEAETYGLVAFADPEHSASEVPVIWRPQLFKRTLRVSLAESSEGGSDGFSIRSLKCCPVVLDASCGQRYIRIGGHDFWIQLVTEDLLELEEDTQISVVLTGSRTFPQRVSSAEQLFSMHQSETGVPTEKKRLPNRYKLLESLLAWDIYDRNPNGKHTLRDVAAALVGEERVAREWSSNRSFKDMAIRARNRGRAFVGGGYCGLLRRATF